MVATLPVIAWLLAAPMPATDLRILVKDASSPLRGVDVETCVDEGRRCYPVIKTDDTGIAVVRGLTSSDVVVRIGSKGCGGAMYPLDLRSKDLSKPVELLLMPSATLALDLQERGADGGLRPVRATAVQVVLHPRSSGPNRQVLRFSGSNPRLETCVPSGTAFDVEVTVDGFYLASSRETPLARNEVRRVSYTLRRKPADKP